MITPPDDYLVLEVRRLFGGVAVTIISVAPNNAQTHYQLLMGVPTANGVKDGVKLIGSRSHAQR